MAEEKFELVGLEGYRPSVIARQILPKPKHTAEEVRRHVLDLANNYFRKNGVGTVKIKATRTTPETRADAVDAFLSSINSYSAVKDPYLKSFQALQPKDRDDILENVKGLHAMKVEDENSFFYKRGGRVLKRIVKKKRFGKI